MTLHEKYTSEIAPSLIKELGVKSVLAVPKLVKIVVNIGLGEALENKKVLESVAEQMARITGQKPIEAKAKRSIAAFKLRSGMKIGLKVTLRGKRMYDFLEKLITIVLPRVRDFRGVSATAFDGHGNLNIGFTELLVFLEINFDKLDKVRGCEVSIVTTARNNAKGKLLLEKFGFPFVKGN